jgi:hypothetical protein
MEARVPSEGQVKTAAVGGWGCGLSGELPLTGRPASGQRSLSRRGRLRRRGPCCRPSCRRRGRGSRHPPPSPWELATPLRRRALRAYSHRAWCDGHRTKEHAHPSKEHGPARAHPCCPRKGRVGRTHGREKGCAFLPPIDAGRSENGALAWSSLAGPRLCDGQPRRSHEEPHRTAPMVIIRRRGSHALRGTHVAVPPGVAPLGATMALVPRSL